MQNTRAAVVCRVLPYTRETQLNSIHQPVKLGCANMMMRVYLEPHPGQIMCRMFSVLVTMSFTEIKPDVVKMHHAAGVAIFN